MQAGDIIGVMGVSRFSNAVTWLSGDGLISHVAMVVCTEPVPLIIEAVPDGVHTIPLDQAIQAHPRVFLMKALNLTDAERKLLVRAACKYSALGYSYLRCGLVGLDQLSGTEVFTKYFAKHLDPMCSFLVAEPYGELGKDFGRGAEVVEPNNVLRFAQTHPKFFEVLKLKDETDV